MKSMTLALAHLKNGDTWYFTVIDNMPCISPDPPYSVSQEAIVYYNTAIRDKKRNIMPKVEHLEMITFDPEDL